MKKETAQPTILKKARRLLPELEVQKDSEPAYLKRWATSLKQNNVLKINGPCEINVRRIANSDAEIVIIMNEDVFVEKS